MSSETRATSLAAVGCALLAVPLLAHAYAGTGSRWVGDDYCASYIFRDHGPVGGQRWFYLHWGAVPTTLFLMALTDPLGARLNPMLTTLAIALWVAAAAWTTRRIGDRLDRPFSPVVALLLAELLVFATIDDAPNIIQSLYLRVAMFEYIGPLILLTICVGTLAQASRHVTAPPLRLVSAVAAFVIGGFGPTYAVFQTSVLCAAAGIVKTWDRSAGARSLFRLLAAGVAGSVGALVLIGLAPGNAARQQSFAPPPGLMTIVERSVLSAVFICARPLLPLIHGPVTALAPLVFGVVPDWLPKALEMATSPLTLLLAVGVPAGLAYAAPQRPMSENTAHGPLLVGAPVLAFLLVVGCMAPSVYGTSAPPPPRALIVPGFALTVLAMCWGFTAGEWLRMRDALDGRAVLATVGVALILAGVWAPLSAAGRTVRLAGEMRAWAGRWDESDRQLRLARRLGQSSAAVPTVGAIGGVGTIGSDPPDWVSGCAAAYYGLQAITGTATR